MMPDRIPPDVVRLLRDHVKAYEELEVLLLFAREAGDWTPEAVATELRMPTENVHAAIDALGAGGLLLRADDAQGERVRRHPGSAPLLLRLQHAYDDDRIELMALMTRHALERVRTAALRAFASAFELRRKHDG
jgi:hypothetical protein